MTDKAATVIHTFLLRLCSQRLSRQSSSLTFAFGRDTYIYINIHTYVIRTYIYIYIFNHCSVRTDSGAYNNLCWFPSAARTQL